MARLKMQNIVLPGAEYIVLSSQVVGSMERGFDISYDFDGERFKSRQAAIRHGLKTRGSDDFNIGVLQDGRLSSIDWMHEVVDNGPDVLTSVAEQLGLPS